MAQNKLLHLHYHHHHHPSHLDPYSSSQFISSPNHKGNINNIWISISSFTFLTTISMMMIFILISSSSMILMIDAQSTSSVIVNSSSSSSSTSPLAKHLCRQTLTNCTETVYPYLQNVHYMFPTSSTHVNRMCMMWSSFVDCIRRYISECFDDIRRTLFHKSVENSIDTVHAICSSKMYQDEYLKKATCFKQVSIDHCGEQYQLLIDTVAHPNAHDEHICCAYAQFKRCVNPPLEQKCGRKVKNLMDHSMSFLITRCPTTTTTTTTQTTSRYNDEVARMKMNERECPKLDPLSHVKSQSSSSSSSSTTIDQENTMFEDSGGGEKYETVIDQQNYGNNKIESRENSNVANDGNDDMDAIITTTTSTANMIVTTTLDDGGTMKHENNGMDQQQQQQQQQKSYHNEPRHSSSYEIINNNMSIESGSGVDNGENPSNEETSVEDDRRTRPIDFLNKLAPSSGDTSSNSNGNELNGNGIDNGGGNGGVGGGSGDDNNNKDEDKISAQEQLIIVYTMKPESRIANENGNGNGESYYYAHKRTAASLATKIVPQSLFVIINIIIVGNGCFLMCFIHNSYHF